jgi:hypothetical protein
LYTLQDGVLYPQTPVPQEEKGKERRKRNEPHVAVKPMMQKKSNKTSARPQRRLKSRVRVQ